MKRGCPRVLLLTAWPPDAKYKILRRYVDGLSQGDVVWASLQACGRDMECGFRHAAFLPAMPQWRVRRTAFGWWFLHEAQARRLAGRIQRWAMAFDPQILWVLPELGAAPVAWRLKKMLGIPMHVTSHDAYETAKELVPRLYYPFYARSVRRVLAAADSLDAVSEALVDHHAREHANLRADNALEFPPSIDARSMTVPRRLAARGTGRVVRIGLCGSMRVGGTQWSAFLGLLGGLPFQFEIVTFVYEDLFPNVNPPSNVRIVRRSFADTEEAVIADFHESGVEACYLGLFKEEHRRLFGRTSLSAKLTTYLAAGLPVIVDGPEDSAAWQMMKPYDAGVLFDDDEATARRDLTGLFGNPDVWRRKAEGAQKLCREKLDLDRNMEKFKELLGRTVSQ